MAAPTQTPQGAKAPGPKPNAQASRGSAGSGLTGQKPEVEPAGTQIAVATQSRALAPVQAAEGADPDANAPAFGAPIGRLPVELEVSIPLPEFRVRDLLSLELGRVVESEWSSGVDLPLAAGDVQLAWSEFEVIELQLAVRLTRLA